MDERPDTRQIPASIEAEEAALGAALISIDAARDIAEIVKPADFYRPQHRHIAGAIHQLLAAGDHVDHVTVSARLTDRGTLDDAGGMELLGQLIAYTPAISQAAQYAQIVRDHAVRRRIIYASGDLATIGYEETDPSKALARVGDLLEGIASTGALAEVSTLEVADIAELLSSDLQPEDADLLTRTDGGALLYLGKMHMFQAEPTAGKSWIALHACAEAILAGGSALYLDYEDSPRGILSRLINMGIPPKEIARGFRYAQPLAKFGTAERAGVQKLLDDIQPDLVVIDGVGESMVRSGLSEDKADDVVEWIEEMARPIARSGSAVLMIDHVVKDPEQRGRWARGSGAKLAVIDGASYQLKVITPFHRHQDGKVHVVVAKDRPGGVGAVGDIAAVIHIRPTGAGAHVAIEVEPYVAEMRSADPWKPTHLMAQISTELDRHGKAMHVDTLSSLLVGRDPKLVRNAIARLEQEGYISRPTRRLEYVSLRLYHDPDPVRHPTEPPPPTDDDYTGQLFDEGE